MGVTRQCADHCFQFSVKPVQCANAAQAFLSNFEPQGIRHNHRDLLVLAAELGSLLGVEGALARIAGDCPIRHAGHLVLPGIVQLQQEAVGVAVFHCVIELCQQGGMPAFLHVVDELAVELIELVPTGHIPLHALGWAGHAQIGLGERLLELGSKPDRLVDILISGIPMALAAFAHPLQHFGRTDGLGRHRVDHLADDVPVDLFKMVNRHQRPEITPRQIFRDLQ